MNKPVMPDEHDHCRHDTAITQISKALATG
jgi:hypothetical protein